MKQKARGPIRGPSLLLGLPPLWGGRDIGGLVFLLFATDPGIWANYYAWTGGQCSALSADMNGDGAVNGQDIDGFVEALFGG